MIKAGAFLALEASLSERVQEGLSLITKDIYSKVDEALASGDLDKATQELKTLSLDKVLDDCWDYVLYLTHMAMLFGASRVTQRPGTSVVGMGFEKAMAETMANTLKQMLTQKAEEYLWATGNAYIHAQKDQPVQKAERVLKPFTSFMDSAGNAYFDLAASLHTSRVSAYGFTAEASVLGITEYQINEQLDNRTCPVCRKMHGKTYKVSEARKLLEIVTRVADPDELKQLQPWPAQTKETLDLLDELTPAEMVARGWHIPPFHPKCRGLLTRAGRAPALKDVVSGNVHDTYTSTQEDFKALGLKVDAKKLAAWNAMSPLSPGEVIARLTGRKPDEFYAGLLTAKDPKAYAGIYDVKVGKETVIALTQDGFGSKNAFDQTVMINGKLGDLHLDALDLSDEDQGAGVAKKYMRELYTLAKDMGLQQISLTAGLDVGGYAWAKYGFKPSADDWKYLKADIADRYVALGMDSLLSDKQKAAYKLLAGSDDPAALFTLADLSFGKPLLLGQGWDGVLDLGDAESVTRFLTYIGELK